MSSSAKRSRRGRNKPSGSAVSSSSLQRQVQSLTDKLKAMSTNPPSKSQAKSKARRPSRPNPQGAPRARPARGSGAGPGLLPATSGGSLHHVLRLLARPRASPVRTRLETFKFRTTFPLLTSAATTAPAYRFPMILFRPDRNLCCSRVYSGRRDAGGAADHADWTSVLSNTPSGTTVPQSGSTDLSTIPNWVGSSLVSTSGTVSVYDGLGQSGECIPTPNSMLSTRARAVYGVCRFRITCGPTTRGYLVYRLLNGYDARSTASQVYADMDADFGNKRIALKPGVSVYDFVCPVEDPTRAFTFGEVLSYPGYDLAWLAPVAFSFRDVTYNPMTDNFPEVEYSTIHTVQVEVPTGSQHLANVPAAAVGSNAMRETSVAAVEGGGLIATGTALWGQIAGRMRAGGAAAAGALARARQVAILDGPIGEVAEAGVMAAMAPLGV